jgi:hypothetical protein
MDINTMNLEKEFDNYKKYLSSCLKTPSLTHEQEKELQKELQKMLEGITRNEGKEPNKKNYAIAE